jgi:sec-independent protein translocase protein TatA
MVGDILQPTHLLFVLLVALLVLGPKRLPEVGRTLGSGLRDFRQALSGESHEDHFHTHHEPEVVEERHQPSVEPEPEPAHTASAEATAVADPATAAEPVTRFEPAPEPATIQPLALGDESAGDTRTEPDA